MFIMYFFIQEICISVISYIFIRIVLNIQINIGELNLYSFEFLI